MRHPSPLIIISLAIALLACSPCGGLVEFRSSEPLARFPTNPIPLATFTSSSTPSQTPAATATATHTGTPSPTPTPAPATATPTATPTESVGATALVTSVIDGDTIEVEIAGQRFHLRYIGIDCPETTYVPDPLGDEATARNAELVAGKLVILEKDISETDDYGRLLRYVYLDGTMVNATLVREGLARAKAYPPDTRYQSVLSAQQQEAQNDNVGIWNLPTATSVPTQVARAVDQGYTCDGCIKGNISSEGEKIYHFPGCPSYEKCRIDLSNGERFFSSEAEAREAGWRIAGNCP